jgi:hypothetical protein
VGPLGLAGEVGRVSVSVSPDSFVRSKVGKGDPPGCGSVALGTGTSLTIGRIGSPVSGLMVTSGEGTSCAITINGQSDRERAKIEGKYLFIYS